MARPRGFDEETVVAQATALFLARGYRDTTPRELMEATGLSKSSLYSTFGSKEGLFLRSMEAYVEGQEVALAATLADGSLRAALTRMFAASVAMATGAGGEPAMTCLVCRTSVQGGADARVDRWVTDGRRRFEEVLVGRMERAIVAGELAGEAQATARFVMTTNLGIHVMANTGVPAEQLIEVAQQAIDAVCT